MQNERLVVAPEAAASFEAEGAIFLLGASGLFFAMETLFHYESFLHQITLKSISSEALSLVIGSAIISLIYFWMGFSCWRSRGDPENFAIAMFVSGFFVFSYFVVEITASAFPSFFYASYLDYAQFIPGYGSVTIFVEMLALFFTYRAEKLLRHSTTFLLSDRS